ncbi:response regulator [Ktedonospora formicarum]|nr:response regulator [Ktedonospora formicarum]
MLNKNNRLAPRVLVVEPQWDIAMFLEFLLVNADYEVEICKSGEDGLRSVERAQPDLIILEPTLPDLDEWAFCQRLRPQDSARRLYLLILTWKDDTEAKRQAHRAGADAFMTKPFAINELMEQVRILVPNPANRINRGTSYTYNRPSNGPNFLRSSPPRPPQHLPSTYPCPYCGSELRVEDNYCLNCGQRIYS